MSDPQRILFLLPSIRQGGMERLVSILARGLDPERFAVEIVVLHRRGEDPAFAGRLPSGVPIRSLDKRSRYDLPRTLRRLIGELRRRRPAAAIGFMTYQNLLLVAAARIAGTGTPVIATEHVTPDALRATGGKRLQLALAGRAYRRAAAVVPVSEGLRAAMARALGLPPSRMTTIYNPFDPDVDRLAAEDPPPGWFDAGGPTLVAVGRLTPQKAYPRLLEALCRVRERVPARLVILGEGEERASLEARIAELGLAGAVQLPGFVPNPFPAMRAADAFVLASDWEAFPFVLVEAMRVGAAVVATDSEFGPNEIIEPERSGLLVPTRDPAALADAILRILSDRDLAERLRQGARQRSEAFAPDTALRRYTQLLEAAIRPSGDSGASPTAGVASDR
jgi:glycosyltransferase involved in cell wall biosynthesis